MKCALISRNTSNEVLEFVVKVSEGVALLAGNQMNMLPVVTHYPSVLQASW